MPAVEELAHRKRRYGLSQARTSPCFGTLRSTSYQLDFINDLKEFFFFEPRFRFAVWETKLLEFVLHFRLRRLVLFVRVQLNLHIRDANIISIVGHQIACICFLVRDKRWRRRRMLRWSNKRRIGNRIPSCLERLIQFRQRHTASPAIPDDTPDVFQQLGNVLIVCRPEMRPCRYPAAATFSVAKLKQMHQHVMATVPYKTPHPPRLISVGLHKSPPVLAGAFGSDPFYFLEGLIGHLVPLF